MRNITAKNKAKELMQKAYDLDQDNKTTQSRCKQIALLCADEVFHTLVDAYPSKHQPHTFIEYWSDVKDEIIGILFRICLNIYFIEKKAIKYLHNSKTRCIFVV